MRTITLALAGVGVTLGLAACTTGGAAGTTTPSASAGTAATGGTTSGGSPARSCVVGNWRGTGMNATFDAGGPTGSASGGAGLELKVSPDGRTVIDFSRMQPVNVQADAGGTQ